MKFCSSKKMIKCEQEKVKKPIKLEVFLSYMILVQVKFYAQIGMVIFFYFG